MNKFFYSCLYFLLFICTGSHAQLQSQSFWYAKPAVRWMEALPIGNGRVGAMVFGSVDEERIALNESTFWSGAPGDGHENPGATEHLDEIRALFFAGDYAKAQDLCRRHLLGRKGNYGTHLPVGNLLLRFEHGGVAARDYRRSLSLDEAVASTSYTVDGTRYTREAFVSHPDGVLILHIECDSPGALCFEVGLDGWDRPADIHTEGPDSRVLLDPFEEQLDLPAGFVQLRDSQGR